MLHSSPYDHQSMSHGRRTRNPKKGTQTRPMIPSRTNSFNLYFENLPKMDMMTNPSYPLIPFSSSSSSLPRLNSSPYPLRFQQPPLLPLPVSSSSRQFQSLPIACGNNKKSSKKSTPSQQKSTKTKIYPDVKPDLGSFGDTKRWVSDPETQLPKNCKRVTFASSYNPNDEMKYSALVFTMAPPPSSLPIPKFSIMKPKITSS